MKKNFILLTCCLFLSAFTTTIHAQTADAAKEVSKIKDKEKSDIDKAYKKAQDQAEDARKDAVKAKADAEKAKQKAVEAQQKADNAEKIIPERIQKANEAAEMNVARIRERTVNELNRVSVKYNVNVDASIEEVKSVGLKSKVEEPQKETKTDDNKEDNTSL